MANLFTFENSHWKETNLLSLVRWLFWVSSHVSILLGRSLASDLATWKKLKDSLYLITIRGSARHILGDTRADSGGEGKSKQAEKYGSKKSKERREEPLGTMSYRSLLFFEPYFSARLDFPPPPLSAPGSPRMCQAFFLSSNTCTFSWHIC